MKHENEKYNLPFNLPFIKVEFKNGEYQLEIPIEFFNESQVYDEKTGEFLGWVDAKNHRIGYYKCVEIIHKEDKE